MGDTELLDLLRRDPRRGWPLFIKRYTPILFRLIRRGGLNRYDDVMDVYVQVCERLAEADCARLTRYRPGRGSLVAWLAVVIRRVIVDRLRARAGRRRHFRSIQQLDPFDRDVFELRYWHRCDDAEAHGNLETRLGRTVTSRELDLAIARVERALTARHRAELLAASSRIDVPVPLDAVERGPSLPVFDPRLDPERRLLAIETLFQSPAGFQILQETL